jgi:hypothetical protein
MIANGPISFYGTQIDPFTLNHTVGVAPFVSLGWVSKRPLYGTAPANAPGAQEPQPTDILCFQLDSLAVADLNNAIGSGFFTIAMTKDLWAAFSGSTANGNPQLVLDVEPAATPIPGSLPLFVSVIALIPWRLTEAAGDKLRSSCGSHWRITVLDVTTGLGLGCHRIDSEQWQLSDLSLE